VCTKPPSVNALHYNRKQTTCPKTGRALKGRGRTSAYDKWRSFATVEILKGRPPRIKGPYDLVIELGRRKGSDLDNRCKALSDLLQSMGVVANDSHAETIFLTWADDLPAAQCRFRIRPHAREASLAPAR
jgi:Holliday junction resolvase RusA-like endonuclease